MKRLYSVYTTYYINKGKTGIHFLRDAISYLDSRNEHLNANKSIFSLLLDWAKRVEFNKTTRF
jgi:hypothetical protein